MNGIINGRSGDLLFGYGFDDTVRLFGAPGAPGCYGAQDVATLRLDTVKLAPKKIKYAFPVTSDSGDLSS